MRTDHHKNIAHGTDMTDEDYMFKSTSDQLQHVISDEDFFRLNKPIKKMEGMNPHASQCRFCGGPHTRDEHLEFEKACEPKNWIPSWGKYQKTIGPGTSQGDIYAAGHYTARREMQGVIDSQAEEISGYTKTNVELLSERDTLAEKVKAKDEELEDWRNREAAICPEDVGFEEVIRAKKRLIYELVWANPDCCWRKCWGCGKTQVHRESITPGVLCRFCGSQDTRLLKEETQALKG